MKYGFFFKNRKRISFLTLITVLCQIIWFQAFQVSAQDQVKAQVSLPDKASVQVNGKQVNSGAEVFSGDQIENLSDSPIDVQIGNIGLLKVQGKTKVTLTFGKGNMQAVVQSGCVSLFVEPANNGSVIGSTGEKKVEMPTQVTSLNSCAIKPSGGLVTGGRGIMLPVLIGALAGGGLLAYLFVIRPNTCRDTVSPAAPGC